MNEMIEGNYHNDTMNAKSYEKSYKRINQIISETIHKHLRNVLTESQESKSIDAAKKLYMERTGCSREEADEFVRITLRNAFPILRNRNAAKFIDGVTRMFLDGQLTDQGTINQLNTTLKYVSSDAHIGEYNRDLNDMSAQDLIQRFAKAVSDDFEKNKSEIDTMNFEGKSQYEIVRIDSFEQAQQYGKYTSWCVTHNENMFNSYTNDGTSQFYFCLRNGFENEESIKGENCPLDNYGLSMIAVSVDENGRLNTCTCRWNHDNGGNDSIMDPKQISEVIGMNFYQTFKPNNKWKELVDDCMRRLANGEDLNDVFDDIDDLGNGFALVELNGRYNFINQNGQLVSPNQWFDDWEPFYEGFAAVGINYKYNFINVRGELLWKGDQWFDDCWRFNEGFARVELNDKYNFINTRGELLWKGNQWFDYCGIFYNGFVRVELNGRAFMIDTKGQLHNLHESRQRTLRLTESEFRKLIKESVRKTLYNLTT